MSSPKQLTAKHLRALGDQNQLDHVIPSMDADHSPVSLRKFSVLPSFLSRDRNIDDKSSTTGTEVHSLSHKSVAKGRHTLGLGFRLFGHSAKTIEEDDRSSVPSLDGKETIAEKRGELEIRKFHRIKRKENGDSFWKERSKKFENLPLPDLKASTAIQERVTTVSNLSPSLNSNDAKAPLSSISSLYIDPFPLSERVETPRRDSMGAVTTAQSSKGSEAREGSSRQSDTLADASPPIAQEAVDSFVIRRLEEFRNAGHSDAEVADLKLQLLVQGSIRKTNRTKYTFVTASGEKKVPPKRPLEPPPC